MHLMRSSITSGSRKPSKPPARRPRAGSWAAIVVAACIASAACAAGPAVAASAKNAKPRITVSGNVAPAAVCGGSAALDEPGCVPPACPAGTNDRSACVAPALAQRCVGPVFVTATQGRQTTKGSATLRGDCTYTVSLEHPQPQKTGTITITTTECWGIWWKGKCIGKLTTTTTTIPAGLAHQKSPEPPKPPKKHDDKLRA